MHTSSKLNLKIIIFHADDITRKFFNQFNALTSTTHHHRPTFLTLFLNKGHLGWKSVTIGYKLTAPRRTALYHTTALDCKLEHALRNPRIKSIFACVGIFLPGTMKWGQTRINLYRLVLFVSIELIACARETKTLLYETENKWTRICEYNKLLSLFSAPYFFLINFTHQPQAWKHGITWYLLSVCNVHPA